ncbi:TonB family protein [Tenacibaculum skagerrakense]|uniref:TonB family protein n=1 Tax=Tenacibaculum skagerrakense TaxID=186571 RepID=A0A4R2NQ08_9FLAO|nr:energy transducer TonB [Tenacibaculum skagerrakense]TCP23847.1 TonB family protein [Tenacibaculum skagerrakense]
MKKVTWLLFSLFMINSAFSQSDNDHTVKIKKNNNSSKNIEVEIVYKKKTEVKPTTIKEENSTTDKTRFLIKRKDKSVEKSETPVEKEVTKNTTDFNSIFTFDKVDRAPIFTSCKVNGITSSIKCFKSGITQFIKENFEYPEEAIEDGTTGKVTIKFTINKEGKVVDVVATDENDVETLTQYSVELLSKLPKLEAGVKEGKPVATSYEFQLDFSL